MMADSSILMALTPSRSMRPFPLSALDRSRASSEKALFANAIGDQFSPDDAHVMMLVFESEYPSWFAEHENILGDPLLASRDELQAALSSAPTPFMAGMVYQALAMRIQLAQITGREEDLWR